MMHTFQARLVLLNTFLFVSFYLAPFYSPAQVSVYFAAHEDDWQLFMGVNAFNDMQALQYSLQSRVVIIHLTAGDAGMGMSGGYTQARENCSMNSVRLATAPGSGTASTPAGVTTGTVLVNGHPILHKDYGRVTSYFFRLPDGCGQVQGCCTGTQTCRGSLEALCNGNTAYPLLKAVDLSTTYTSWADLVQTAKALLNTYNAYSNSVTPGSKLWLNMADTYTVNNPNDHRDHIYTAKLALAASSQLCPHYISYVDYHITNLPPNMSVTEIENKSALYGACSLALLDGGYKSNWEPWHKGFIDRNYYRAWTGSCKGPKSGRSDTISGASRPGQGIAPTDSSDYMAVDIPLELTGGLNHETCELYPQPAGDRLNVRYAINGVAQPVSRIEIQDVLGRHTVLVSEGTDFIDTGTLSTGIYFAKIYNSSGHFAVKKFYK